MSAFVTLGNAARLLAGACADAEEIAMFAAVLQSQADSLHAVRDWTEHGLGLPGGMSYLRPAEQWRIPKAIFSAWCAANGYTIERDGEHQQPKTGPEDSGSEPAGRRAKQIGRILEFVRAQGWDASKIPTMGKQKAKAACLEDPGLFTDAGFTRAWQAAVDDGLIRTEKHESYARR